MILWARLTSEQWSAVGTVVSAIAAVLNLAVVLILVGYNKRTTRIMTQQAQDTRAQTSIALRTLAELNLEKSIQNNDQVLRVQGCLKDLGDLFLVLEQALNSIKFVASDWKAKPQNWHEIGSTISRVWPQGISKITALEQRLRAIDINLKCLAEAPLDNNDFWARKATLKTAIVETTPLIREIWEGMIESAVNQNR